MKHTKALPEPLPLQGYGLTSASADFLPSPIGLHLGRKPSFRGLPRPEPDAFKKFLRKAIASLASSVVEKRAARDSRALAHMQELRIEAESAASEALALILTRFHSFAPNLQKCLASRLASIHSQCLADGKRVNLSRAMSLPVWRAAHKACDRALRKMARETATEDVGAMFDATGWHDSIDPLNESESVRAFAMQMAEETIRAKHSRIRLAICEVAEVSSYHKRSANKFLKSLTEWESRAIALLLGAPSANVISSRSTESVTVTESLSIRNVRGQLSAHDGKGATSGTRTRSEKSGREQYFKAFATIRAMEKFLGIDLRTEGKPALRASAPESELTHAERVAEIERLLSVCPPVSYSRTFGNEGGNHGGFYAVRDAFGPVALRKF